MARLSLTQRSQVVFAVASAAAIAAVVAGPCDGMKDFRMKKGVLEHDLRVPVFS